MLHAFIRGDAQRADAVLHKQTSDCFKIGYIITNTQKRRNAFFASFKNKRFLRKKRLRHYAKLCKLEREKTEALRKNSKHRT